MELGNFCFGHSRGNYSIDRDLHQEPFCYYLDLMGFYDDTRQYEEFKNETFEYRPYWWGDYNSPESNMPNFKHYKSGLEISWYKYPLRDSYSNFEFTRMQLHDIMEDCLGSIRKVYNGQGLPNLNMVEISKIRTGFTKIYCEGEIISVSEPRSVKFKTGGEGKVADAILKDATGEIKLNLWGEEIAKVRPTMRVKVENGYATSFKDKTQLNIGKFGKLIPL